MNELIIYKDSDCEMLSVHLNGKCVGFGNYWDFHNGGICTNNDFTFGEFSNSQQFIENIKNLHSPINVSFKKFSYEENRYDD